VKYIQLKDLRQELKELNEKRRLTKAEKDRKAEIEENMKPLQKFMDDAAKQRKAIKDEIGRFLVSMN
jgi:hypothetical protein